MDKLDGYWSLLRGRLLASEGNYEAAIREAEVLVRVNSGSNYSPELLMIAADSYRKLAKADKATAVLQRIVKEYRDSPLAAEAAKKLKGK
jgi:TolA-binding protein